MTPIKNSEEIQNPSVVKVIVDLNNFALYFSRSVIPHNRDQEEQTLHYKHIGVYAFRKEALMEFSKQEMTPLEAAEKVECIRYLEHGKKLKWWQRMFSILGSIPRKISSKPKPS